MSWVAAYKFGSINYFSSFLYYLCKFKLLNVPMGHINKHSIRSSILLLTSLFISLHILFTFISHISLHSYFVAIHRYSAVNEAGLIALEMNVNPSDLPRCL